MQKHTKQVKIHELKTGDIVQAHGARFEITAMPTIYPVKPGDDGFDGGDVANAPSKWIEGKIERGYFGPGKNWSFQGNERYAVDVEI